MSWTILFTKQAQKDARKLASASPALKLKDQALLELLASDPYAQPPPYESLVGDLRGACPGGSTSCIGLFTRCLKNSAS